MTPVLKFVAMSLHLQHSMMVRIIADSQSFDNSLLSTFATLPVLTRLVLGGELSSSDQGLTLAILRNCPPSLQRLDLCCLCQGDERDERFQRAESAVAESEKSYQWKRFESLKSLSISCDYGGCESWAHIPLLKNSPHLRLLNLMSYDPRGEPELEAFQQVLDAAIACCPDIDCLRVDPGDNPLTAAGLVRLIQAYPKGLESLIVSMPKTGQELVISAIFQTSAATPESFTLIMAHSRRLLSITTVLLGRFRNFHSCMNWNSDATVRGGIKRTLQSLAITILFKPL
ncbi:hypothetical protein BGX33_003668 [Mortierella sp. NVP41]|nr:hypothetical protein BGX33_003668 [Mortierella sp. NVP41]